MSNLNDLQNFIVKNERSTPRRSANRGPVTPPNEDKKLSDEEMREANVKAIEEAKESGKSPLTPNQTKIVQDIKEDIEESKEMPLLEKDGGGGGGAGGAGGAGGLAGGGTVAVASDPGVFTPTYGGDSKRRLGMAPTKRKKKKKKKEKDKAITTGVTKADRFLRGEEVNQARKSVQQFAQWLVEEARTGLIQLDAKKENVNTGEVNESPRVASKPTSLGSQKVKNPQGRRGNFGPAPGQQGVSRPQFSHHFSKMKTITEVLNSNPSVLSLLKALDTDVPIGVD